MEDRHIAQHQVPIAELWRDEQLESILVREDKGLPLAELGRSLIPINDDQIESSIEAGN